MAPRRERAAAGDAGDRLPHAPGISDEAGAAPRFSAFRQALAQLGWTEGRNLHIDYRWGEGKADNIRRYAGELVPLRTSFWLPAAGPRRLAAGDPVKSLDTIIFAREAEHRVKNILANVRAMVHPMPARLALGES